MKELPPVKVLSVGGYCQAAPPSGPLPDLKGLVSESTGINVRRVTRFVQLALIGASRCAGGRTLDPETAVYLSSCRGDTEVTASLLEELVHRRELPSPLTFVNSVSNAACFHVASALGLQERSNFVTNRFDPIAAALKLACLDIACGETRAALVGSVDACSVPLENHRRRIHVGPEVTVGEASHWLLIAASEDERPAIGRVAVANFSRPADLQEWIERQEFPSAPVFAAGQHLRGEDRQRVAEWLRVAGSLDYRRKLPYYDTATGAALEYFFKESSESSMLHINSDPAGRFSIVRAERH